LEQLQSTYNTLFYEYDEICDRIHAEHRSQPTPAEENRLEALKGDMDGMSDRLSQLREVEERRMSSVLPVSGTEAPGGLVHVRSEPEVYRQDNQTEISFFRDLLHSQVDQEPEARSRVDRHSLMMRATGTTTTGAGAVPPTWLFNEFAIIAHGARPWADTLRKVPIDSANPVNVGTQTGGAVVAAQVNEGDPPADGSFVAPILTTQPKTYTGKIDVSRQLVDGSNPAIDGIVYADAMGAYNEQIEQAVVAAFEAATGMAATITYPGTAPAYVNLPDAFIDAAASVGKHRKMPPRVVLCGLGSWAFLMKQKDTQNRPLVTTGYAGPVNAYGIGEAAVYGQIAGTVVGLSVVPSWAGNDNHFYVVKADDCLLLESSTFNFRYEEVLGPSAIRLGVWGYAAPVIGRYKTAIAKIDAGTTIPSPAEAEPADTGSSTKGK
jgi:HK97 family phage major capsid protein